MKTFYTNLKTAIFCFLVLTSLQVNAQTINEGLEEAVWVSAGAAEANQTRVVNPYADAGTLGTGSWMYNSGYVNTATPATFVRTGTNSFFLAGSSSAYICTPLISVGVAQVTVVVKSATGTAASMVIGVATNTAVTANTGSISSTAAGAAWSVGSSCYTGLPVSTAGWTTLTFTTNLTAPAYIKFQRVTTGSIYLDDIVITGMASTPNLTVAPSTLSGFTYEAGSGPSTSQSFTVSGTNLTAPDVVVTAPANYQVSLDNVTFTNSVNIVHGLGNLAATTVYARLIAGLAVNTYNGNVTTAGGGVASGPTVALAGTVTAPAVPTITTSNAPLTFTSCPSGTDTETIIIQGTLLSADVSMTLAGAGAARYSLAPAGNVPFATANGGGQAVIVTYTGTGAPAGPHVATLTLASAGATSVVINLSGTTSTCYTLTTNVAPVGGGIVTANPSMVGYPSGTVVTLAANPNAGYTFDSWTGDASGGATTNITMNANKNVTANFIVALPPPATIACLTEDFEGVMDEGSDAGIDDEYIPDGTTIASANLVLGSGTWPLTRVRLDQTATHSGTKAIRIDENGSIFSPTLDNPQTVTFWVRPRAAYSGVLEDGMKIQFNGANITTGVTISGVPAVADGFGRFTINNTTYREVIVTLNSSTQGVFKVLSGTQGNDRSRYLFDDFSVQCAGMSLEASPDQTGLNYVIGTGPSAMKPVIITGEDLAVASGTVTLSNMGNFEISFNGGTTWLTGAAANFAFTSNNFVKLAYVRLKAGLALGAYSQTITLTTPSYTKISPTLYLAGNVVSVVSSPDCTDESTISKLVGKSNTVSDLATLLIDDVTGDSWVANARVSVTQKSGVNYVRLQNMSSGILGVLKSPTINFGEYQADKFIVSLASTTTTAVPVDIKYSIDGGSNYILMQQVTTSDVANYFTTFTIDLSPFPIGSSVKFLVTPNTSNEVIISNFTTTAKAKRALESSVPLLENFEAHVNCPSEVQSFRLTGTCMDDDGTITFGSTNFEFSTSASGPFGNSISYTGAYPVSGITIYARQKGAAATDDSVIDQVAIAGGGVSAGLALQLFMMGEITSPTISSPLPNQVFNFVTPNAVATRKVIDIASLATCADFTVTTSGCGTVTTAGCEAGPYAAGTTISQDFDNKKIYLQYTPGAAIVNCRVRLTSGVLVQDFYVNWSGYAAGAQVYVAEKSTMTADLIGIPNPITPTASVPGATVANITSSAGAGTGFEFSVGDPGFGDFVPITTTIANNLGNLYIRKKPATAPGTTETITISSGGVTSAVFTVTAQ